MALLFHGTHGQAVRASAGPAALFEKQVLHLGHSTVAPLSCLSYLAEGGLPQRKRRSLDFLMWRTDELLWAQISCSCATDTNLARRSWPIKLHKV